MSNQKCFGCEYCEIIHDRINNRVKLQCAHRRDKMLYCTPVPGNIYIGGYFIRTKDAVKLTIKEVETFAQVHNSPHWCIKIQEQEKGEQKDDRLQRIN